MKLYGIERSHLTLIDGAAPDDSLDDVLRTMWEEPARIDGGFVITDPCGRTSAVVTVLDVVDDHDGIVEVYQVGGSPRRLRIRYVFSHGEYARTDITPVAERT